VFDNVDRVVLIDREFPVHPDEHRAQSVDAKIQRISSIDFEI